MNDQDFLEWKAKLVLLTTEQLDIVLGSISLLKRGIKSTTSKLRKSESTSDPGDWFLIGVTAYLKDKGLLHSMYPVISFKARKRYEEMGGGVRKDIHKLFRVQLKEIPTSNQKMSIGLMVAECLAEWLKKRKIPISINTMVTHCHRSIEAIEESYPGYISSGLLPAIIGDKNASTGDVRPKADGDSTSGRYVRGTG